MNDDSHHDARTPVALITGGSAGLGMAIAKVFVRDGYHVVIVGRSTDRVNQAAEELRRIGGGSVTGLTGDVSDAESVQEVFATVREGTGRLDVLINCVGASDRGLIENLQSDRLQELIVQNVSTALLCSQAAIPLLEPRNGVIVNIGSLAGKVGARYLGGYAVAKHALSGMTQQMRLELRPRGIHVTLLSPGPIRRSDEGARYDSRIDETLPDQASAPGAGTRVKGLDPDTVARAVLRSVRRRHPDVILPRHLRMLVAVGHLVPRLGDWLLRKFTSTTNEESSR